MATFDFSPGRTVPETLPPELGGATFTSATGWNFSSRPTAPYQRRFRLQLYGLRWYLDANDLFDYATNPQFNANALERFYAEHLTWKPFDYQHPHIAGLISCRFAAAVQVPKGVVNSGGEIEVVEVTLVEHNPRY